MSKNSYNFRFEYKWELLILLWGAFLLNQADRAMFGFVMPLIKTDLDLTDIQLGLIASTFHLFYGVLAPLAGYVGDILRRSRIVVSSIFIWSGATVLTGCCSTITGLILFRGMSLGLGEAFYLTSANALIAQYHEKTRALAMSIHQTALYCGMIGSGIVAGWLAVRWGWRSPFILFGLLGLCWASLLFFRLKDTVQTPGISTQQEKKTRIVIPLCEIFSYIFHKPSLFLLAPVFGGLVFINVGYITWMPTLLHEQFHLSLSQAGFSSMFYHVICALIGVLVGGKISDRLASKYIYGRLFWTAMGFLLAAPFICLMGISHSLPVTFLAIGGFGIARGICDSSFFPLLFDVVDAKYRSSCQGFIISFGLIIGAIAPIALGYIKSEWGLRYGIASMALVAVLTALITTLIVLFFKKDRIERELVHGD